MKATVSKDELRFFLKRKLEKKMQQGFVFFQDTGINGLDADTLMQNFATTYQVDIKKFRKELYFSTAHRWMDNPTTIPLNMSPFRKKSMKNLKILFLLLFFKISFVGLTQNIYKIGLIHLYSYHSFETKCERNIKNCPKRKLTYDKVKRQRNRKFNSMSLYTDIAVEKKYISEFYKCIFYDKNLEFITLSNDDEIYKSFLQPGPCYPFGTFLMTFFDRKNKMIKQIKIDSFEDLQKIFAAYMEQFSSEKDRHFLKEKLIPHLLSGYEFDLYIRNSTN